MKIMLQVLGNLTGGMRWDFDYDPILFFIAIHTAIYIIKKAMRNFRNYIIYGFVDLKKGIKLMPFF